MPCPFYRGGRCVSPILGSLSTEDLYERGKCDGDGYKSCKYYREAISISGDGILLDKKPDPLLNVLEKPPKEVCPLMRVAKAERGYVAYCSVLDRFLTRYEVSLCEQGYHRCPLKKIAFSQ
ncbi:MAG: hypothetical protein ACP5HH_01655 [Fervidicoccaceae archaeon]